MKTIEDKLHIAHELGRIAGAAECIEDEGTRDTIYGAAESLFDGLLAEAVEEERDILPALKLIQKAEYEAAAEKAYAPRQPSPPDPFDYAEVEDSEEPEPKKETNFDRITKSPEVLAEFLGEELSRCPDDMAGKQCNEMCIACWLERLNEEAKDE